MRLEELYDKDTEIADFRRQALAFRRGRSHKKEADTLSGYILSAYEMGKIPFDTALAKIQGLRDEGEITQDEFDQASNKIYAVTRRKEVFAKRFH